MSDYLAGGSILALALSPLFVPVGFTVIHRIRTWRPNFGALMQAINRKLCRLPSIPFDTAVAVDGHVRMPAMMPRRSEGMLPHRRPQAAETA